MDDVVIIVIRVVWSQKRIRADVRDPGERYFARFGK